MGLHGISAKLRTELANVPLAQARRWKRTGRLPARSEPLVALRLRADLGVIDPAWQRYHLKNGLLWTPETDSLTPSQIRAAPWWRALAKLYQHQLKEPQQYDLI